MTNFKQLIASSKASIEKEDLALLLPLLAEIKPKVILEIGTWRGYSADVWQRAFDAHVITVENDQTVELAVTNPRTIYVLTDSHEEETLGHVKFALNDRKVDFLFIDGDHSYAGVKKDFEMYSPLVRKGGIIVFHDALYHAEKTEEVDWFWNEIKEQYEFQEIKAGKHSTGIGIIWV